MANVLQLKSVTQKSFAEYHSKRSPVERVHAVENRTLSNEVFSSTSVHKIYTKGDQQHKENIEIMANEVVNCLKTARYNGRSLVTQRGTGEEDHFVFNDEKQLLTFLSRSENLKNENDEHYFPQHNTPWQEVALLWNLNEHFVGCYREDYQMLENTFDEEDEQTCISNKYTTILSPEIAEDDKKYLFAQPIPDYVRWFKSGGELLHYFSFEKMKKLNTDVIDATPAAFLPSKILDIAFKLFKHDVDSIRSSIALLSWCPEDEVIKYFSDFSKKLDKSFENGKEREYWRQHELYKTNDKATLKRQCHDWKISPEGKKHEVVKRLVETQKLELPPRLEKYDGDIHALPTSITELSQFSLFKLREILRYHNVLDCGTKDELAIRVSMVISGTTRLAFKCKLFAIKNLITATKLLIQRQKSIYLLDPKFISKQRKFPTPSNPAMSTSHPRDSASVFSRKTKAFIPVTPDISIETLDDILKPIEQEASLYSENICVGNIRNLSLESTKLETIRTVGANVLALWSKDEIDKTGWKTGEKCLDI